MQTKRTALALLATVSVLWPSTFVASAQDATPTAITCEEIAAQGAGTPQAMTDDMADMDHAAMGTPPANMDLQHMTMELDQMYIDMMIPHHQSIIAMAQAALPRLSDERLRQIAQAVIETQGPEIEELQGYREAWYGDPEPMPMDDGMMASMNEMMPGMSGAMEEMAFQMNAAAQVAAICAADNTDLAFIDQTIPHHQMAIEASEAVLEEAVHPEIRDVAQRVIDAQQREIDELTAIRQELFAEATPAN
jgi:uncharacterized protein (DUF305 family)